MAGGTQKAQVILVLSVLMRAPGPPLMSHPEASVVKAVLAFDYQLNYHSTTDPSSRF